MKNNNKSAQKYVNILGINVASTSESGVIMAVREKIAHNSKFYIVTPNPELVLMAQKDFLLKEALNSTEFSIPDGTGLYYASLFLYGKPLKVIHGRDLFLSLIKLADKNSWRVFFLGGKDNEAALAASKVSLKFKKIKIQTEAGPMFNNDGEPSSEADRKAYLQIVKKINSFKPELLMLCLSDPKEEKWAYKNYNKLNIGGAGAFGGTFRYIAGMSKLPPKWMGKAGLEWVYRLITEPYRWRRILNAFPIFPLRVFWFKVMH